MVSELAVEVTVWILQPSFAAFISKQPWLNHCTVFRIADSAQKLPFSWWHGNCERSIVPVRNIFSPTLCGSMIQSYTVTRSWTRFSFASTESFHSRCQTPRSRNILSARDMQYQPVSIMHSLGPFWTVQMSTECIRNLRLDIGPFECSSECSNLQPDSPPLLVPEMSKDRRGDHSSFHSRRYTASASPVWATCSRLVSHFASIHSDLAASLLAVSRHIFIQSSPDLRQVLAKIHFPDSHQSSGCSSVTPVAPGGQSLPQPQALFHHPLV